MIAFVMAVILAGAFTWLVFKRIRATMGQQQTTKIVVAANDLPAGVALSEKDVNLVDWPSDVPLTGTFTKIQDVVGHPLIRSLGTKEPIFQRDLGLEGSGVGLATKIPPGMRATAVRRDRGWDAFAASGAENRNRHAVRRVPSASGDSWRCAPSRD